MRRVAGAVLLVAVLVACEEHGASDGPILHALLRHGDGSTTGFNAVPESERRNGITTCSAEQGTHVMALEWPHAEISVGEFELSMPFNVLAGVRTDDATTLAGWDGSIFFDAIGEELVEGRFEVEPLDRPLVGLAHLEDGQFSCPAPP